MYNYSGRYVLLNLVKAFRKVKILVVGDIILDEYIVGNASRLSPEAPVPIVEIQQRNYAMGGAANVAANIKSFGGTVFLGGVVGSDLPGQIIQRELLANGIGTDGILIVSNRPTTIKTRIVAGQQQIVRLDLENRKTLEQIEEEKLFNWIERVIQVSDVCVISDYAKGVISPSIASKFIKYANDAKKNIIVDPKGINYTKYVGATVLTPNFAEAMQVANLNRENSLDLDIETIGKCLLNILPNSHILITRGGDGMSLFQRNQNDIKHYHIESDLRQVYDVSGAGDTVVSMLALALAVGINLEEASQLANYAAGIVVGKSGTATITVDELMGFKKQLIFTKDHLSKKGRSS